MKYVGRKGGKLEPQFTGGPYIVAEYLGKGRYRLEDANGMLLKTDMNCHRLKRWFEPDAGRLVWKSDGLDQDAHDKDAHYGDAHDGDAHDGEALDGDALDGDVHDGDTLDRDALDGDAHDGDAIDVDTCNGGSWKRIGDVSLTEVDKKDLLTESG